MDKTGTDWPTFCWYFDQWLKWYALTKGLSLKQGPKPEARRAREGSMVVRE